MSLIIVADTHIAPDSAAERDFFEMLAKLGDSPHDIVFLGDLFDLWIALPGYEKRPQAAFLKWCREQKQARTIGLIEGNHEFFVAETHGDNFSWSTSESSWLDADGCLFVHGDRINSKDSRYLMFRRLTKNSLTRKLLRYLPGGPWLCNFLSHALRQSNPGFRQGLPESQIQRYADQMFDHDVKSIFVGHFHTSYRYEHPSTRILYLVPAWFKSGQLTLVDTEDPRKPVTFFNWDALH
jgi:UDP-2,3-diacylglucosamine pyrophosphatase LpxH